MLPAEILPGIIETEEENERVLAVIEKLMKKGEGNLSREEISLFRLLVRLSEDFEEKSYPQAGNSSTPRDVLAFFMEQHGLKQKDLAGICPIFIQLFRPAKYRSRLELSGFSL